ncbi:hypothetical protein [Rhodoferax sp.]|uniref:hypothetical protein n=1 Tax=Rhodoferax sp. TaxID=50421 RepID=UPI002ACE2667|nr:hypothetical protein [Rhodoferax sp.]MDZ7922279.1 hypothetical protein [Rhodoferax sp.]
MNLVSNLICHNNRGDFLPELTFTEDYEVWRRSNPDDPVFGPIVKHTWHVDGVQIERLNQRNDPLYELPDATGFLLCEHVERSDNLVLLDVYGKERVRLAMPWQLTQRPTSQSAGYPSRFLGLTTPWDNPKTGQLGKFAVLAWVEYAGDYAFELDWKTGQFLWGYFLERG